VQALLGQRRRGSASVFGVARLVVVGVRVVGAVGLPCAEPVLAQLVEQPTVRTDRISDHATTPQCGESVARERRTGSWSAIHSAIFIGTRLAPNSAMTTSRAIGTSRELHRTALRLA